MFLFCTRLDDFKGKKINSRKKILQMSDLVLCFVLFSSFLGQTEQYDSIVNGMYREEL